MKRSSLLHPSKAALLGAFLVSLSLTYVGAAAAAPPNAEKIGGPTSTGGHDKSARMMAQAGSPLNQQSTDPSSGSGSAPSNAPSPSGDASQSNQPAVTVGTPATTGNTADTPQSAAASDAVKPKARPFAGSSIFLSQSMTTNTIFKGQTQYDNPTVESNVYITPRYAINEAFQIRARLTVSYEWTNSDSNTYDHEPTLSDTSFQLFYRKIPAFAGIKPAVALNLGLPTSKSSRARTLIMSPGATAQFVRGFENVLGGELDVIASLNYSHPLYSSRQPEAVDKRPYQFQCVGGTGCGDVLSGSMNTSDSIGYSFIVSFEKGNWNPALAYIGGSSFAYRPKETVNPVDGTVLNRNADASNVRQSHYLSAWLDYNFTPWITGEIGYWNAVSGVGGDGQRSNIFFDRYQDTRVYLGASIQLDNLVKTLQGTTEGSGGVVRAQAKPPMFTF